jgi:hypothetical protein
MNLRHIDPRSTDWMDAMLEGDWDGGRAKPVKREAEQATDSHLDSHPEAVRMMSGGTTEAQAQGSRPPPGR